MSTPLTLESRVLGSLIGAAVGDALGAPCECMHYQKIREIYGDFHHFEELESTWFKNRLGQITDDTVLADLLTDAMLTHDGVLDAHLFAREWERFEAPIPNPDGEPINRLNMMHWIERIPYMRNQLREINKRELGHGEANATNAVMYIGPVGLLCAGDPNKAAVMAADVTSVNQHGSPRDVAAGYAATLAACFLPGASVERIIDTAMAYTRDFAHTREMAAMLELAARCADCDEFVARYYTEIIGKFIPFQDLEHIGKYHWWFKDELTCVSWNSAEILGPTLATLLITRGADPAAMMLACAKIGRDADTICRCAGGLIGALNGRDAIPQEWQDYVLARNRWLRLEDKGQQLTALIRRRATTIAADLTAMCAEGAEIPG